MSLIFPKFLNNTLIQGYENPWYLNAHVTKFCTMAASTFSIILAVSTLRKKICFSSHALTRKHQITVTFTDHFRSCVLCMEHASCTHSGA